MTLLPKSSLVESAFPFLALAVPVVVAALLISAVDTILARVVTDALIMLIMVVGLYIFVGNSGIFAFGHGAFIIIGSYASAWLTIPSTFKSVILPNLPELLQSIHLDPLSGALVAMLGVALFAGIVGFPLMRLSGIAASIATFALFYVVVVVYNNWTSWTKGTASLVGMPVYTTPTIALLAALAAMLVAYVFQRSRYGILLKATREDAAAAKASGVSVERSRLIGFVLSAAVIAGGGILQGHFNGALTTTGNVHLNLTFLTLAMLVVGGMRSLAGCVVGVAIIAAVAEVLRQLERGWQFGGTEVVIPGGSGPVVLGILMLVVLVTRPQGVTGGKEVPVPRWLTQNRRDLVLKEGKTNS